MIHKHYDETITGLNKKALQISYVGENYIEENSLVLPIDFSNNWLELHFHNYLGIDKPLVILENCEANIGWFPLVWDYKNMPKILLAGESELNNIYWPNNKESNVEKEIDYVFIYGETNKLNSNEEWQQLSNILNTKFKIEYKSADNYILLFKKIL